jgi:hypothetical protein
VVLAVQSYRSRPVLLWAVGVENLRSCTRISNDNVLIRNAIGSELKAFHSYDPSP